MVNDRLQRFEKARSPKSNVRTQPTPAIRSLVLPRGLILMKLVGKQYRYFPRNTLVVSRLPTRATYMKIQPMRTTTCTRSKAIISMAGWHARL